MYKKAWLTPMDDSSIGIGYVRDDGTHGCIRLTSAGHPDLPKLMKILSDEDLHIVEASLKNVVPFSRS